jgi:hypothetical protein
LRVYSDVRKARLVFDAEGAAPQEQDQR